MKKGLAITLRAFIDFIPLIVLWSIPSYKSIFLGLIASTILIIVKYFQKNAGLMTKVVFVYFVVTNIMYFKFNMSIVFEKRYLISYAVMASMCFISIKMYKPFTMDASRKAYKNIENSPLFIEMNIIISKIFGIAYLINTILAFFKSDMLNVVSPILTFLAILSSIILPSFMPDV